MQPFIKVEFYRFLFSQYKLFYLFKAICFINAMQSSFSAFVSANFKVQEEHFTISISYMHLSFQSSEEFNTLSVFVLCVTSICFLRLVFETWGVYHYLTWLEIVIGSFRASLTKFLNERLWNWTKGFSGNGVFDKKKETNICTALKSYYVLMAQRQNAPLSMKRSRFEP